MWSQESWYGGAKGAALAADTEIIHIDARVHAYDPTAGGFKVKLPDARRLREIGGPRYVIINEDFTHSIILTDNAGTTLVTILFREAARVYLHDNSTAAGGWYIRKSQVN